MLSKTHGGMKLRYACVETELSIAYEMVSMLHRQKEFSQCCKR